MAKDTPAQSAEYKERKPWKKKQYAGKVIKSELRDNRFFKDQEFLDKNYTQVADDNGRMHWEDEKGGKFYLDDPIEATQYFLTIEVLEGEKKGDWAWVYAPHRFGFKKDNTVFGVRAKIALAIDEDFDLHAGIEDDNSDLLDKPFYFVASPKDDPQYAKVTDFLPMEADERAAFILDATEVDEKYVAAKADDPDCPF